MQTRILMTALVAFGLSGAAANAQSPSLVKQNKDWQTYTYSGQNGKVCYALSKPTQLLPSDRNHGDVFFFISTRPAERVKNEPSVIVGYDFKEGSIVTADVDGQKFNMFTKGDGAWVQNAAEEQRLISAMKAGRKLTVSGVSKRNTKTTYEYSLSGVTAAIGEADKACQ
ncbi:invasion associated locus B family protein [Flexibacterium corallicola]|uniref:invasion associated locus B family protein n=1 Tax=Flexibacterium corallicola TaxID=3037259 RepID=UPI00286F0FA3|nr:invasion associated locus B family protein [Pseudovibrio sp. M1P-2-3]